MKTGVALIEAISVWCPHCQSPVPSPDNGSTFLTLADVEKLDLDNVRTLTCTDCDERFKVPALARKVSG